MTSDDLIGRRVVLHPSNEKGTVRWVGNLPNQRQQRIGIELDEVDPDRHDGTFDGIKYFDTRRPKCGTFAKVNFGKDLRQCLREKYQTSVEYEDSWMVGEEDVKRKLAEVDKLEYVGLEGSELATVGTLELNELTDMLTRVRELNLKDSLLHDWHEVDLLLAALPNLENLSLAGNRFNKFPEVKGEREFCGCPKLKSLDISSTLIPWSKATSYCLLGLDNLQFINLSANDYDRTVGGALPPACLTTVVMMDNQFDDISRVLQLLPTTVEKLVLCGNKLGDELPSSTPDNSAIRELSISRNDIKDWRWIGELAKALPKLMSLRITDNPIYDDYVEVKCDGSVDGATSDGPVGSAADRSRQVRYSNGMRLSG
ncbi:sugar transporter [Perkinsus olseni]|uniref:Sugar transporter n=1 Tax=Perkinsus olseni TaxID=32597 RepID=A0A7J6NM45_PEROL|nr:sugar transporter [Perkinsus olseni]